MPAGGFHTITAEPVLTVGLPADSRIWLIKVPGEFGCGISRVTIMVEADTVLASGGASSVICRPC